MKLKIVLNIRQSAINSLQRAWHWIEGSMPNLPFRRRACRPQAGSPLLERTNYPGQLTSSRRFILPPAGGQALCAQYAVVLLRPCLFKYGILPAVQPAGGRPAHCALLLPLNDIGSGSSSVFAESTQRLCEEQNCPNCDSRDVCDGRDKGSW
jgi:hypothetical protein